MKFTVEGKNYEIIIASDVNTRDGIGCELWDVNKDELLLEIFRDDTLKRLSFYTSRAIDFPLEVLDLAMQAFNEIPGRTFIDYGSPEYNQ
ncbi:hypothetical protein GCM10028822_24650 [Hymenobacter terrigena]